MKRLLSGIVLDLEQNNERERGMWKLIILTSGVPLHGKTNLISVVKSKIKERLAI
jgi:hypothetical protein